MEEELRGCILMRNLVSTFALAVAVVTSPILFAASPPEMQLSDSAGNVITIDSTGSITFSGNANCIAGTTCHTTSSSAAAGTISWAGTIGAFSVPLAVGRTKPGLPSPQIDLSLQGVTVGATSGTLTVKWTDTGFSGGSPATMAAGTIFPGGSGSVIYTSYVDNTNAPFGMGTSVGTLGPITSTGAATQTGPGPTAQPFSMTNVLVVALDPNSSFDTDFLLVASQTAPPQFDGCTVTQGGWGAPAHGNNPGAFLNANFATGFPMGATIGGSPSSLLFTSPVAVRNFLPQGGPPSFLNASATNPTARTSAGVFAGQVLALELNVVLHKFGSLTLSGTGTPFDGSTVGAVLAAANLALAGGPLPAGFASYSQLNDLIDNLNSSFDGCAPDSFATTHLH
jgi:hypothetical protein